MPDKSTLEEVVEEPLLVSIFSNIALALLNRFTRLSVRCTRTAADDPFASDGLAIVSIVACTDGGSVGVGLTGRFGLIVKPGLVAMVEDRIGSCSSLVEYLEESNAFFWFMAATERIGDETLE